MTVVVFGGAGFVGLNIVEAALERGENVTVFDRAELPGAASAAFERLSGTLHVIHGDVTAPADVARAFAHGAHAVVYGAAVTAGIARDREAPETILDVNLLGFLNVLRRARDAGAGRIINLSSAGAFGEAAFRHDILREETHADPVSLYSMTKFASERTASRMADVWGIDALSVRLSGVFGRWERRTSVRDTPSPQYQLCAAVRAGRPARIPRRDHRDWIYAPDVASAVLALIDAPRLNHRLYNVSTGERWAVFDWAEAFALHWPSFDISLTEPGERADIDFHAATDRGMLSIERLVADTGFKPAFDRDASAADYADWARGDGAGYG